MAEALRNRLKLETLPYMLAGDFIRWMKQIVDLLDQIAQAAQDEVAATAREAIDKIKRGIVAYSYYG